MHRLQQKEEREDNEWSYSEHRARDSSLYISLPPSFPPSLHSPPEKKTHSPWERAPLATATRPDKRYRLSRVRMLSTEGMVMKEKAAQARTKAAVFLVWFPLTSLLVSMASRFTLCGGRGGEGRRGEEKGWPFCVRGVEVGSKGRTYSHFTHTCMYTDTSHTDTHTHIRTHTHTCTHTSHKLNELVMTGDSIY